jgi:transposase InsO family protein
MIDRTHDLPLARQAALLRLSRSSLYYEPQPVLEAELSIMRRIDALHLDYPFAGSRMLRDLLRGEGVVIGRERVRTLMRRMCIEALYRRANTSRPSPGHKIYPYLLHGLAVERADQVWCMDITYVPMAHGFAISQRSWTGSAGVFWPGGYRSPWRLISAWRRLRRHWPGTANPRFSTPIKVLSSPAPRSPACCGRTGSRSAWTVAARGGTMSLSSGYGDR